MKKIFILIMFMMVSVLFGQVDPPSGYTTYYGFRMWSQGDHPGSDSINANWIDIDLVLNDLVTYADPRYFSWNATEDTLTLNTYTFGTIGFANGENLFLPYHDPPWTNFGGGAIAYTTGGWVTFNNSAETRYDTLASHSWVRTYIGGAGSPYVTLSTTQNITGAKTFQQLLGFSSKDGRLVLPDNDVGHNQDSEGQIQYDFSSNDLLVYNGSSYDTYAKESWVTSSIATALTTYMTLNTTQNITGDKTFQGVLAFSSKDGRLIIPDDPGFNDDSEGQIMYVNSTDDLKVYDGSSYITYATEPWVTANFISTEPIYTDYDTSIANPAHRQGRVFWDSTKKALSIYNEEEDVTHNLGRELFIRVYNNSGDSIVNGMPVYPTGAVAGGIGTVAPAQADSDATSNVIGIATHTIENNTYGYVTRFGDLSDVNTVGLQIGGTLYLSATDSGGIVTTKPIAPNNSVPLGGVTSVGATGSIFALMDRFDPINGIASVSFADSAEVIDATTSVQVTNAGGNLFTYNTSVGHDITLSGDTIYVAETGIYDVILSVSFQGGNGGLYQFIFKENGVIIPNYSVRRATTSADVGAAPLVLSVAMDAGDYLTLWVEDLGSSANITMVDGSINITQVR